MSILLVGQFTEFLGKVNIHDRQTFEWVCIQSIAHYLSLSWVLIEIFN